MKKTIYRWPRLGPVLLIILIALIVAFAGRYLSVYQNIQAGGLAVTLSFVVIVLALFSSIISYYEYHGFGKQDGITRRVNEGPYVSLTFDDGPGAAYTPKILDILKKYNVKATFFVVGKHVKKYPEIARQIAAEGHDVGNHTYSHKDLVPATKATVIKEITKTEQALLEVLGMRTDLFRPPRGIFNQTSRKLIVERGYRIILWSVSSCDWRLNNANMILRRIKRFTKNGSIILFHDSGALIRREGGKRAGTVKSLPLIIEHLHESGFKIIPVSELIALNENEPEAEPVEI